MIDIPIVHGYAAVVANATDVVGLCLCDRYGRYSSTYSTILTLVGLNCKARGLVIVVRQRPHLYI